MDKKITSSVVLASFATAQFGILNAQAVDVSSENNVGATVSSTLTNASGVSASKDVSLENTAKEAANKVDSGTVIESKIQEDATNVSSEEVVKSDTQNTDAEKKASDSDAKKLTENVGAQIVENTGEQNFNLNAEKSANEVLNIGGSNSSIGGAAEVGIPELQKGENKTGDATADESGKTPEIGDLNDKLKQSEVVNNKKNDAFASVSSSSLKNTVSEARPSIFSKVGDIWNSWFSSKNQKKGESKAENKNTTDTSSKGNQNTENGVKASGKLGKNEEGVMADVNKNKKTNDNSGRREKVRKDSNGKEPGMKIKGPDSEMEAFGFSKKPKSWGDSLLSMVPTPKIPATRMAFGMGTAFLAAHGANKLMDNFIAPKSLEVTPEQDDSVKPEADGEPIENSQGDKNEKTPKNAGASDAKQQYGNNSKSSDNSSNLDGTVGRSLSFSDVARGTFLLDKEGMDLVNSCTKLLISDRLEDIVKGKGEFFGDFSNAVKSLGLKKSTVEDLLGKDSNKFVSALNKLCLTINDIDALVKRKDNALGSILKKAGFSDDTVEELLKNHYRDFQNLLDKSAIKSDVFYSLVEKRFDSFLNKAKNASLKRTIIDYFKRRIKGFVPTDVYKLFSVGYDTLRALGVSYGYSIAVVAATLAIFLIKLTFFNIYGAIREGIKAYKLNEKGSFRKFLITNKDVQVLYYYFGGLFRHILFPLLLEDNFFELTAKKYVREGQKIKEKVDYLETFRLNAKRALWYPICFIWKLSPPVFLYNLLTDLPTVFKLVIPGLSSGVEKKLEEEGKKAWEESAFVKGETRRKEEKKRLEEEAKELKQKDEENSPVNKFKKLEKEYRQRIKKAKEEIGDIREEANELLYSISADNNERGPFMYTIVELHARSVALENYIRTLETDDKLKYLNIRYGQCCVSLYRTYRGDFKKYIDNVARVALGQDGNAMEVNVVTAYENAEEAREREKNEILTQAASVAMNEDNATLKTALKRFFGVEKLGNAIHRIKQRNLVPRKAPIKQKVSHSRSFSRDFLHPKKNLLGLGDEVDGQQ